MRSGQGGRRLHHSSSQLNNVRSLVIEAVICSLSYGLRALQRPCHIPTSDRGHMVKKPERA